MQPPPYLPEFRPENGISEEQGKQDKIEIEIEGFKAWCPNTEEIDAILKYMGASPPVYEGGRPTRIRENHGDIYGFIFNTIDTREWEADRTVKIRKTPLEIEPADGVTPPLIQPPLFAGDCRWRAVEDSEQPLTPWELSGKLALSINPTRFTLYHPTDESLPEGILKKNAPLRSSGGEAAYDRNDNFLPLAGPFRVAPTPQEWQQAVSRYLTKIVRSVPPIGKTSAARRYAY